MVTYNIIRLMYYVERLNDVVQEHGKGHLKVYIKRNNPSLKYYKDKNGTPFSFYCAAYGDAQLLDAILSLGLFEVNQQISMSKVTPSVWDPLPDCGTGNMMNIFRYVLERSTPNSDEYLADKLDVLVKHGFDLNAHCGCFSTKNKECRTFLSFAIARLLFKTCSKLLDHGLNVKTICDRHNRLVLPDDFTYIPMDLFKRLVTEMGSDTLLKASNILSRLIVYKPKRFLRKDYYNMAKWLINFEPRLMYTRGDELEGKAYFCMIYHCDVKMLEIFLDNGLDVNYLLQDGGNICHAYQYWLYSNGNFRDTYNCVSLLLRRGISLEYTVNAQLMVKNRNQQVMRNMMMKMWILQTLVSPYHLPRLCKKGKWLLHGDCLSNLSKFL